MPGKTTHDIQPAKLSQHVILHQASGEPNVDLFKIAERLEAVQGTIFQAFSRLLRGCTVLGFTTQGYVERHPNTSSGGYVYSFVIGIKLEPVTPAARKAIEAIGIAHLDEPQLIEVRQTRVVESDK